ncbi:SagB/ThcOx family dehydrogenase [Leucobacter komagatae]|uniref:SagB/ThcOx family dehydrogenase n=1 Tax=Leucobacter komagatae TaxID=55969 RepID=UPI0012EE9358|nr:SagB/ThcOx family dehydrogenase [Leucobacter komagatae]
MEDKSVGEGGVSGQVLSTAAQVRVTFSDARGWVIADLGTRKSYRIDARQAAIAVAFMSPCTRAEVKSFLQDLVGVRELDERIDALIAEHLVQDASASAIAFSTYRKWNELGWSEAHDYLVATSNFPFVDYSKGGQEVDKSRMRGFALESPDETRSLARKGAKVATLPTVRSALEELSLTSEGGALKEKLLRTAAVAVLPLEWRRSRTPGRSHMRRTSPSGGSRHPTELYLLALDVPDLARGIYHFSIESGDIGFVAEAPSDEILSRNMIGAFRLAAPPRAVFILTTHFQRNMYRYREPRTFRTLYLDAGHLGGLIESVCEAQGLMAHGHHGFQDSFVADLVKSDGLAIESPTYLVSVGLASEVRDGVRIIGESRLRP